MGQISTHHAYIRRATWNGNGSSYACLTNDLAGTAFWLKTGEMATPTAIPWHGGVRSLTLNGNHLFFSGNPDDQAPGIWDYDIESATFKCIVSSTSGPLKYRLGSPSSSLVMTNSSGEQRFYHLWTPRQVAPNQKYPVLLAQEFNTWFPCFQIAAQAGYYVAVVDRPFFNSWDGERTRTWVEDVSRLYEIMAKNPNVDTNRVYLYACSAETFYLSQLINDRPALAKGAIVFSPSALPDVSSLQNKHILIVDGKADGDAMKRLPEFQDRAAEKGNAITVFLQDDAGHIAASGATERNRARQFSQFISDRR
ncbi:MAG: alpha/beta hydrolase family protein [Limisphaerales bacterium]